MNNLRNIYSDLPTLRDENLTNILLNGKQTQDDKINQIILIYIYTEFFYTFSFSLSNLHISGRALLYVSLVNILYQHCLCVNQLYRKKRKTLFMSKVKFTEGNGCNHGACCLYITFSGQSLDFLTFYCSSGFNIS